MRYIEYVKVQAGISGELKTIRRPIFGQLTVEDLGNGQTKITSKSPFGEDEYITSQHDRVHVKKVVGF